MHLRGVLFPRAVLASSMRCRLPGTAEPYRPVTDLRNLGGYDCRHDGPVGHPRAAGLCPNHPQSARAETSVRSLVGVPCGLSGIVDGVQPRRNAGAEADCTAKADFPSWWALAP